jgi:hypothetical protein
VLAAALLNPPRRPRLRCRGQQVVIVHGRPWLRLQHPRRPVEQPRRQTRLQAHARGGQTGNQGGAGRLQMRREGRAALHRPYPADQAR